MKTLRLTDKQVEYLATDLKLKIQRINILNKMLTEEQLKWLKFLEELLKVVEL